MTSPSHLKKRYKPIRFGDPYDPRSVEGHINAVSDAAEARRFNRKVKQREAEREAEKPLHVILYEKLQQLVHCLFRRFKKE